MGQDEEDPVGLPEISSSIRKDQRMRSFFGLEPSSALKPALKVGAIFALVAGAWILVSDKALLLLVGDVAILTRLQTLKGGAFVLVSAVFLVFLVRHYLQVAQRQDEKMRVVAQGVSVAVGDALFSSLARSLARAAEVDCVFICQLAGAGNRRMQSLSAFAAGEFVAGFECDWAGTPCENVIRQGKLCLIASGVRQKFSHPMLERFAAESFVGTPLLDSDGHILGVLVVLDGKPLRRSDQLADLLLLFAIRAAIELERKRTSEALLESERLYRAVFENNGAAILIVEEDTTISMANEEFAKLCGEPRESIEGQRKWPVYVAGEDRERLFEYHRKRRIDPASVPKNYEFRFIGRDGRQRVLYINVSMIPGTTRSVVALWDVTARKQAEEELAHLAAIVESAEEAIVGKTLDGIIFSWNPAAERLYGYSATEMKGHHIAMLVPEERSEELNRILDQAGQGKKVDSVDSVRLHKDGRKIWIRFSATPIWDSSGRLIGVTTIARQIEGPVS
jgi:PAS domain S-box-containing protein